MLITWWWQRTIVSGRALLGNREIQMMRRWKCALGTVTGIAWLCWCGRLACRGNTVAWSKCNKTNPIFELYTFFWSFCISYHLSLCYHVTVRLMSGSLNSHHAPAHMTKSLLTWLSASSCDSQSHSLITFYLTCNALLSSPLLLSFTFKPPFSLHNTLSPSP